VNNTERSNIAPESPRIGEAAVGATSPLSICSGLKVTLVATAAKPKVVANANGMANHARPPIRNPFTADLGLASLLICLINEDGSKIANDIDYSEG
jgi:hypothetical protein